MSVLAGIEAKLERSEENVGDVTREIAAFLDAGGDSVIPDHDEQATIQRLDQHFARMIPPRISVLAAECIHNLRSSLDHLAWHLVVANGGEPGRLTCFPIYRNDPFSNKDTSIRYRRSVKGMSTAAHTLIQRLQPYQAWNKGIDDPLWILHSLSITDKHHSLVLAVASARPQQRVSFEQVPGSELVLEKHPAPDGTETLTVKGNVRPVKVNRQFSLHVSFAEFGSKKLAPVPDALSYLKSSVRGMVTAFRRECAELER